jgi:hypothetical protein
VTRLLPVLVLLLAGCAHWPAGDGAAGDAVSGLLEAAVALNDAPEARRVEVCREAQAALESADDAAARLWFGLTLGLADACAAPEAGLRALRPVLDDPDPARATLARLQSAELRGRLEQGRLESDLAAERARSAQLEEKLKALTSIERDLNRRSEP